MKARHDPHPAVDRGEDHGPPGRRDFAARRRDADQKLVGGPGLVERGHDRDRTPHPEELVGRPARLGGVEDRDDVGGAIAEQARRGLAGQGLAVSFCEQDNTS